MDVWKEIMKEYFGDDLPVDILEQAEGLLKNTAHEWGVPWEEFEDWFYQGTYDGEAPFLAGDRYQFDPGTDQIIFDKNNLDVHNFVHEIEHWFQSISKFRYWDEEEEEVKRNKITEDQLFESAQPTYEELNTRYVRNVPGEFEAYSKQVDLLLDRPDKEIARILNITEELVEEIREYLYHHKEAQKRSNKWRQTQPM